MLHKTRGIVLRFTPYRESTIIVNIFTELFGLQAYIVNGVRSKQAKSNKIAFFQPLTLLDMVVYHKENANMHRLKEFRCYYPYVELGSNIIKSSMGIFLNELFNKVLREESHAHEIFSFVGDAMITLDKQQKGIENFHLILMVKLSHYLGFGPANVQELLGPRYVNEEEQNVLAQIIKADFDTFIKLSNEKRRILLGQLLAFYQEHIDGLGEMRSVNVLREVLD
ncbi:MAG TPA: DNA repair protein RecO [Cyclobacteriaceae bacterium]|nr:DNA repair protein RecO [Cyclobacteriaceae bacterium]